MPNQFPFNKVQAALKDAVRRLPAKLGTEAVNFFRHNFRDQGWNGNSFMPWTPRKGGKDKGRGILIKSGRLRRSIRIARVTSGSVVIATDVPYARAHNEGFSGMVHVKAHSRNRYGKEKVGTGKLTKTGKERMRSVTRVTGTGAVGQHNRYMKMPRRQFMGDSPFLNKRLERVIAADIIKALKF